MSSAIFDVKHVIGVDDVHPAELVSRIAQAHNRAVEHFETEHTKKGEHTIPVVATAVARWNVPALTTVDALVNGVGSIAFAMGFSKAPRFEVGRGMAPLDDVDGYYLRWKLARPVGRQFVAVTPGWSGSGNRSKMYWQADSEGNGTLLVAGKQYGGGSGDAPVIPANLSDLTHITIAIFEIREAT